MSSVTLAQASTIVDAALAKARELSLAPMTVVVLDAGGHVVAAEREDGSSIKRFEIGFGKAHGALSLGMGNGDLVSHVAAFSPGFAAPDAQVGRPGVFITHGVDDRVLPIDRCSRRLVPRLRCPCSACPRCCGPRATPSTSPSPGAQWPGHAPTSPRPTMRRPPC